MQQHDPELAAETRAWLLRTGDDLRAAELMLSASPPLAGTAVFHAQQAAEKVMKAFLTWHSRPFRKTHNLTEVGGLCTEVDPSLEDLLRRASMLTDFVWRYRYPGDSTELPLPEAKDALALARR